MSKKKSAAKPKSKMAKARAEVEREQKRAEKKAAKRGNAKVRPGWAGSGDTAIREDRAARKAEREAKKATALAKPKRELLSPEEAESRTEALRERANAWTGEWWAIGEETLRCLNERVPESRKKKQSATVWLSEVFGDKWQKLRRAMLSTKALQELPMETRQQISEGNAYLMTSKLPTELRTDPKWVEKAATLKNEEFESAVMAERKRRGIVDEKEIGLWEIFKIGKMEDSFKDIVTRTFETAAEHLAAQGLEVDLSTVPGRKAALEEVFGSYLASGAAPIDVEAAGA